jgi:UDP-glucose 4-epimerase
VPYDIVPRRAGDPITVYADPTLVRETLGWQATLGLEEIIASAYAWHSTHLDGYVD